MQAACGIQFPSDLLINTALDFSLLRDTNITKLTTKMVKYHEWLGWVATQRQQFATVDECIKDIQSKKNWSPATSARLHRSMLLIGNMDTKQIDGYIEVYKQRKQYRELRETGKAGNTYGTITSLNSLPNSVLQCGDESLISEYENLLQVYVKRRRSKQVSDCSYSTTRVMMHFFHSCLGSKTPLFERINTVQDIVQMYVGVYRSKFNTLLTSSIKQHCNRLFVLWQCVCSLKGIEDTTSVHEYRAILYGAIQSYRDGQPQTPLSPKQICFSAHEVIQLYAASECLLDKILLTLLFTTGLRVGGAVRCQLQNMYNFKTETVHATGHTIEKGGVCHEFYICSQLQTLIQRYIQSLPKTKPKFLFPARHNYYTKCCTTAHLQLRFNRLVAKANIKWKAHVHCTRHTLVAALRMIDTPSALIQMYIGHKNIRTTDTYGILSTAQLVQSMQLPWHTGNAHGQHQLIMVLDGTRKTIQNRPLHEKTLEILEKLVHNQRQHLGLTETQPPDETASHSTHR